MPPRRAWKSLGHAVPVAEGLTEAADRIAELEADLARARRLHEATQRTLEAQVARVFSAEEVEKAAKAICWAYKANCEPACLAAGECTGTVSSCDTRDARAALSAVGRCEP